MVLKVGSHSEYGGHEHRPGTIQVVACTFEAGQHQHRHGNTTTGHVVQHSVRKGVAEIQARVFHNRGDLLAPWFTPLHSLTTTTVRRLVMLPKAICAADCERLR